MQADNDEAALAGPVCVSPEPVAAAAYAGAHWQPQPAAVVDNDNAPEPFAPPPQPLYCNDLTHVTRPDGAKYLRSCLEQPRVISLLKTLRGIAAADPLLIR